MTATVLTLDFTRATEADDPWAFRRGTVDYNRHDPGGRTRRASLTWDTRLDEDLAELRRDEPNQEALARLGRRIGDFLLALGWEGIERQIDAARGSGRPVHLRIRSGAAELYTLPWEIATFGDSPVRLGRSPGLALRYAWPSRRPTLPAPFPPGGTILVAASAAGGEIPLDAHIAAIRAAGQKAGRPPPEVLRDVTREALSSRLDRGDVTVLHILCHGRTVPGARVPGLWWGAEADDEEGVIDGTTLAEVLSPHAGSLRLVVLCACESGFDGALGSTLGGVAQALHRAGIASVIASRLPLSIRGSVVLTQAFYDALLSRRSRLTSAVSRAREALHVDKHATRLDWASIQLYQDDEEEDPLGLREGLPADVTEETDERTGVVRLRPRVTTLEPPMAPPATPTSHPPHTLASIPPFVPTEPGTALAPLDVDPGPAVRRADTPTRPHPKPRRTGDVTSPALKSNRRRNTNTLPPGRSQAAALDAPADPVRAAIVAVMLVIAPVTAWVAAGNPVDARLRAMLAEATMAPVPTSDVYTITWGADGLSAGQRRSAHAKVIRHLVDLGVRAIAFTVCWTDEAPGDGDLAAAAEDAKAHDVPVIVAMDCESGGSPHTQRLASAVRLGLVQASRAQTFGWFGAELAWGAPVVDADGRWHVAVDALEATWGAPAALVDGDLRILTTTNPLDDRRVMLAPTGPFHTLDYADLDKWPPMKDKVAFVGAPPSDRGVLQTPYGRMTPLEFTAAVYEALAQKRGLRVADTRWDVLATALAELAALGLVRLLARPFVVAMVLGAVCLVGVTAIGAGGGPWLAPLPPLLACSLAVGALAWKTR